MRAPCGPVWQEASRGLRGRDLLFSPVQARSVNASNIQCDSNASDTPTNNGDRKDVHDMRPSVGGVLEIWYKVIKVREYPSKPNDNANRKCKDKA